MNLLREEEIIDRHSFWMLPAEIGFDGIWRKSFMLLELYLYFIKALLFRH